MSEEPKSISCSLPESLRGDMSNGNKKQVSSSIQRPSGSSRSNKDISSSTSSSIKLIHPGICSEDESIKENIPRPKNLSAKAMEFEPSSTHNPCVKLSGRSGSSSTGINSSLLHQPLAPIADPRTPENRPVPVWRAQNTVNGPCLSAAAPSYRSPDPKQHKDHLEETRKTLEQKNRRLEELQPKTLSQQFQSSSTPTRPDYSAHSYHAANDVPKCSSGQVHLQDDSPQWMPESPPDHPSFQSLPVVTRQDSVSHYLSTPGSSTSLSPSPSFPPPGKPHQLMPTQNVPSAAHSQTLSVRRPPPRRDAAPSDPSSFIPLPPPRPIKMVPKKTFVLVIFKHQRVVQFESAFTPSKGDYLIVEGDRGEDLGQVLDVLQASEYSPPLVNKIFKHPTDPETGCFLYPKTKRYASPKQVTSKRNKQVKEEAECTEVAQQKAQEHNLPMQIVDAEYQFDKKKLTFYYYAPKRVDFTGLVNDLFAIYRARIWMARIWPGAGFGERQR